MRAVNFETRYRDGAYLRETGDWHEEDAAWKASHVRRMIESAGLEARRVADIGCGSGGVLARLQTGLRAGTVFTGYEIAGPAFRLASARGNDRLRFVNGSALEAPPSEPYDLALALDVFEHVPDYLGFLSDIRGLARAFIFHVPLDLSVRAILKEVPMHRRRTVGHLHYFTTSTARATLEDSGYRIRAAFHTHAMLQPPPRGWKARLRAWPHRLLFGIDPALCAKLLGGCSLLVLVEPAEADTSSA